MPVLQRTKRGSLNMKRVLTKVSRTMYSRVSPQSCLLMQMSRALRTLSSRVVDAPFGKRPFRVHYDPTQDGAEVVNMVLDRVRAELLRRIGLGDLLTPRDVAVELQSAA